MPTTDGQKLPGPEEQMAKWQGRESRKKELESERSSEKNLKSKMWERDMEVQVKEQTMEEGLPKYS